MDPSAEHQARLVRELLRLAEHIKRHFPWSMSPEDTAVDAAIRLLEELRWRRLPGPTVRGNQ